MHARRTGFVANVPSASDVVVDDHDALRHDAAAADVDVADLAVAHDACRQADGFAAGLERGVQDTVRSMRCQCGSRAAAIALPYVSCAQPQPSRIASTSGPAARALIATRPRTRAFDERGEAMRGRGSRRRPDRRRCSGCAMKAPIVRRVHAAAVENAGRRQAVDAAPRICAITRWRSAGSSAQAGADRPDRLVSDDAARDVVRRRRRRMRRASASTHVLDGAPGGMLVSRSRRPRRSA